MYIDIFLRGIACLYKTQYNQHHDIADEDATPMVVPLRASRRGLPQAADMDVDGVVHPLGNLDPSVLRPVGRMLELGGCLCRQS